MAPHSPLLGFLVEIQAGPVVLPLFLGALVCWLMALAHRRAMTPARAMTVLTTCAYGAAVCTLTMFPLQIAVGDYGNRAAWLDKINVVPFVTIDAPGFALNIAMTVPLGLLLPFVSRIRTPAAAALAGLVVSGAIEGAQGLTTIALGSGRTADVNDLLANTAGTVLGFALISLISRRTYPVTGRLLSSFALPGAALAPVTETAATPAPGARTAMTAAATSAVPNR